MRFDWHFKLLGWPWWLVLPLAAIATWAMWQWLRPELTGQPEPLRRRLLALRCAAIALLVLLLLEPTFARLSQTRELPAVAVLIDASGSMDIKDPSAPPATQLAEAVALGLVPARQRPLATNATAQAESDARLIAQAKPDSDLARGLAQWRSLTRFQRAVRLAQTRILPALTNRARVRVFAFDQELRPLDVAQPPALLPGKASDLEAPLALLSRQWSQEHLGGVLLLSDGRQTAGRDPGPVARALRARGAVVDGLVVGPATDPPDAVVATVQGSSEVFLEESISLDAKYRVTGSDAGDWDMVLAQNGKEVDRRAITPSGQWQYEHFATPAKQAGVSIFQTRLEPHAARGPAGAPSRATGSITREVWQNLNGTAIEDFKRSGALNRKPDRTEPLTALASPQNAGDNYGSRMRGFIYPPVSGAYTFWLASDDGGELWLSRTGDPKDKNLIASVSGYAPHQKWDTMPSQRSVPITLPARDPCYLEVLHKEGSGDDHVEVGWQLPDGTYERPLPGARLSAWSDPSAGAAPNAGPAARTNAGPRFTEATLANNQAEFTVAVNQDPIRVLLADATPRWETRYLATMFERDRRVQLDCHYYSVLASLQNQAFLPKTQEEWDRYDLIVLGDLDSGQLTPAQQQFAVDYVAKRGGFLVAMAGPRGMPRSFSLGALANVLPVKVTSTSQRDSAPVSIALTDAGRDHPLTFVLRDPAFNQRLWPALPPLQWLATSVVPKPGATVLLEAQNPVKTPVLALQRYGAGRVLWFGSGESWRWRDRLGERIHHTFWLQAMRWGLAGRLRGTDPRLQVGLDRSLLAPGEAAELRGRATTASGRPTLEPLRVKLEAIDARGAVVPGSVRELQMQPVPESAGIWQSTLAGLTEGSWRATVTSEHPSLAGLSEVRELLVRPQQGFELTELSADPAGLKRLADVSGGQAGTLGDPDAVLKHLADNLKPRTRDQTRTVSLWDNYLVLLLVVGLLGAEWVLRKRAGLP